MRIFDVIKNDSSQFGDSGAASLLVRKFEGEDFYDKSQLIVDESEEAVFFRDGVALQVFAGGRYTLDTANHPFLTPLRARLSSGKNAFSCKVYFVARNHKLELPWGTDTPVQVRDPVLNLQTSVQARGSYSLQVSDAKKLVVKLVGNGVSNFTRDELNHYFRSALMQHVKDAIAAQILDSGQEILSLAPKLTEIADGLRVRLTGTLDEYGVRLVNFYVAAIDIPESDPNRQKLEAAFADKGVMSILGPDWGRQQSVDILRQVASNPGAGGMAAAAAGLGLGLGSGGAFAGMTRDVLGSPPTPMAPEGPPQSQYPLAPASAPVAACTSCGAQISATARFCPECGTSRLVGCVSCGNLLNPGAKFCPECGTRVEVA